MKKRGIFPNKKAQGDIESYFVIIKLILAIAAISAMSAYVYSIASDTFFHKLYFSRDIAFMINTVYAAPGNAFQKYERKNLDKFVIDFNEGKVQINEEDLKKQGLSFNYFYATDLNHILEKYEIKDNNQIDLQKSDNIFEISDKLNKKINLLRCPDINTNEVGWKQKLFLIDMRYSDYTDTNKQDTEKLIIGLIGSSLYNKFENRDTTISNIGNIEEQVRKSNQEIVELIEESDVIISIGIGDYSNDNNNIKAYISSVGDKSLVKKRKKLGCLIINELFVDKDLKDIFTGGNVININPAHFKENYEKILKNDKISIVIEVGNIQSDKIKNLENVKIVTRIAEQIYSGVKKYHD